MKHVKLYCAQESKSGKQELVWAAWRQHFQTIPRKPAGLVAATFANQADNSPLSRLCFEFTDRQQMEAFESSAGFNNYIWEVLPLLAQHCTISCSDEFTSDKTSAPARGSVSPSARELMHRINDFFQRFINR